MKKENVLSQKYKEYFNQIFCLEVSEYLFDPLTALKNINKLLKRNGILWMSFCFIYPHHNPEGADMLRYTRWGVEKLLKETGFEIEYVKSRVEREPDMLESFYFKEGMHPCKTYDKHNETGYLIKAIKK